MELEVGAHDAMADVIVLEQLFEYLMKKMIESGSSEIEALTKMENTTKQTTDREIIKEIIKNVANKIINPLEKANYINICGEYLSMTKKCKYIFEDDCEYDIEFEKELLKDIKDIKKVFNNLGQ